MPDNTITTTPPANPMDHFPEEQAKYLQKQQRIADAANGAVVPSDTVPAGQPGAGLLGTF